LDQSVATFKRGAMVNIKYNRNNHAPGGFIRLSLVPIDKLMDKDAHRKGAFHHSCWGAGVTVATPDEIATDPDGYNMIGTDGEQHSSPPAYYSADAIIPDVVPDGMYVFGWSWYGGTASVPDDLKSDGSSPPGTRSFFGE
jgi:hypothetical protein